MWLICVALCWAVVAAQGPMLRCIGSQVCTFPQVETCQPDNTRGCLYCTCSPQSPQSLQCPSIPCPTHCLYGVENTTDENGCVKCGCARRCPRTTCTNQCPHGFQRINGCRSPQCLCNSEACPALTGCTATKCPIGFARDGRRSSCPTCQCARTQSARACRYRTCLETFSCPAGMVIEKVRGCKICRCTQPPLCPPLQCNLILALCKAGPVLDGHGCPTCSCRPEQRRCPPLNCLRQDCPDGFASDAAHCPTCNCLVKPAQNQINAAAAAQAGSTQLPLTELLGSI